jgi:hypothetical protein
MKKLSYFLFSVALVALVSCGKDGEQGPAGPAGPAGATGAQGPAGDDADFAINNLTIPVAEWAAFGYAEMEAPFITQDIQDNGMALCYVNDEFGYWNTIPSQWHLITGFASFYGDVAGVVGGYCGFDCDPAAIPTVDVNVRIVTMKRADYEQMSADGIIADYSKVVNYLGAKK